MKCRARLWTEARERWKQHLDVCAVCDRRNAILCPVGLELMCELGKREFELHFSENDTLRSNPQLVDEARKMRYERLRGAV